LAAVLWLSAGAPAAAQGPGGTPSASSGDPIGALIARQHLDGPASAALPVAIGMGLSETAQRSRFTLELSDPVEVRAFTLANPNRVVVDMPEVLWRVASGARPTGRNLVKSYRYGEFRKGDSRFVIDLNAPARVIKPTILPPQKGHGFELVIDLEPTTIEAFNAGAGWPAAEPKSLADTAAPTQQNGRHIVVIDAGHGDIDPGTHGQSGLEEKALVLSVAKDLRRALEATGRYTVRLTRDTDIFIPLRERVAIARADHADLFVSLHADSNVHPDIRGASVYTLSEDASDREAATLADKENMSDVIAGVDLSGDNNPVASILIDLAQRETMNRSVRFAETVLSSLSAATPIRPTTPHRSAGFAVLKAPDIPAVLIELGYLTNQKDESEMLTESWRRRVADALAVAVDRHFGVETTPLARQAAN
jgi:N-acetylmuramoyl-L-alanine amidase